MGMSFKVSEYEGIYSVGVTTEEMSGGGEEMSGGGEESDRGEYGFVEEERRKNKTEEMREKNEREK